VIFVQSKQDATKQMDEKTSLEKEKKTKEDIATEKEKARDRKLKTIGNYVHPSVPVSDNEVRWL
jgi:seryl-tRNA synthetase